MVALALVAAVWILLFGIRRGPFFLLLVLASLLMLVAAAFRTPRHQDLLMVHQGLIVLGAGSAAVLFLAMLVLWPVVSRVGVLHDGYLEARSSFATADGSVVFLLLALVAPAEELFWRGFVQGRLSEDLDLRRAYQITLAGYALVHLLTLNLALFAAALVGGAAWGWFRLRTGSVIPGIISHLSFSWLMYFLYPK